MLLPTAVALLLIQASAVQIIDQYEVCKAQGFGANSSVCDPDKLLSPRTKTKLTFLLDNLKDNVACKCEGGCRRADGRDEYLGLLMVTDSSKSKSLAQEARQIFEDSRLGFDGCNHGMLMVFLKDTQQIATYRGGNSFVILTDDDMRRLHELASKSNDGGDAVTLQYLLQNYKNAVEPTVTKASNWMPMIGLGAALLVFLLILAVLAALFMSRFCCCCYKNKKEMYQVNTLPTYKTIEPLYVVAPSDRIPIAPHDTIYSTPYSGSPLPFPPPPGASRPITPASTARANRIVPSGFAPSSDPPSPRTLKRRERGEVAEKKFTLNNSSPQSAKNAHKSVAGDSATYALPPESLYSGSTLQHSPNIAYLPPINEAFGTIPRPWVSRPETGTLRSSLAPADTDNLNFLDPRRRLETQTKEDFIF